jgi:large subunit ribosomal protein L4e
MFAPTKTYRRWHRKVNKNQRRFALTSALAASASTALVLARGHRVEQVPEIPLVVSDKTIVDLAKTKQAVKLLQVLKAYADVEKVINSKKIRAGKGKSRNRRRVLRRGPLIIYDQRSPLLKAFRNLPGVDLVSVNRLSLLLLAPGGHLGRFVIWTRAAYQRLDALYGTYSHPSLEKKGFTLPRAVVTNSDLQRLLSSEEVQSKLRRVRKQRKYATQKKNPLRNLGALIKLNPYAKVQRRLELLRSNPRVKREEAIRKAHSHRTNLRKSGKPDTGATSGFSFRKLINWFFKPRKSLVKSKAGEKPRKKNPLRGTHNKHKTSFAKELRSNH